MPVEKYDGLLDRFLKYVKTETRSNPASSTIPSDPKETAFLNELAGELRNLGVENVHINQQSSYLMGTIPSNVDQDVPVVGFISHVDTADFNAHNVNPQIIKDYDGHSDIQLDQDGKPVNGGRLPSLKKYQVIPDYH